MNIVYYVSKKGLVRSASTLRFITPLKGKKTGVAVLLDTPDVPSVPNLPGPSNAPDVPKTTLPGPLDCTRLHQTAPGPPDIPVAYIRYVLDARDPPETTNTPDVPHAQN